MQSIVQIVKVNELRRGEKNGRAWELQDAECILLDELGAATQVGVLMIPRELRGSAVPGLFAGTFALKPDFASRRIEAVLTGLTPLPPRLLQAEAGAMTPRAWSWVIIGASWCALLAWGLS